MHGYRQDYGEEQYGEERVVRHLYAPVRYDFLKPSLLHFLVVLLQLTHFRFDSLPDVLAKKVSLHIECRNTPWN